jgi:hypothetical protein
LYQSLMNEGRPDQSVTKRAVLKLRSDVPGVPGIAF